MPDRTPHRPTPKEMLDAINSVTDESMIVGRKSSKVPDTKIEGPIEAQIERARIIMGADNFFGPDEIKAKYPIISTETVLPIRFSEAEMRRAKEHNQFLRFRSSRASDGSPLTGQKLNKLLLPRYQAKQESFLLQPDSSWYKDDPCFTTETPRDGWAFVSREVIPASLAKNYLYQTRVLATYLRNLFEEMNMPGAISGAIGEFEEYDERTFLDKSLEQIQALLRDNATWNIYAQALASLTINKLFRPTFIEQLDDIALIHEATTQRILSTTYSWTATRVSEGRLVCVGYGGAKGAHVDRFRPGNALASLGVVFSRM